MDEDEAEDVASSSSIRSKQSVSLSSSSNLSLSQIQLQQLSTVAQTEAGAEDSRVVMAAVAMVVVGVECAGSAGAQGTMSVCAHGWRRLQSG